MQKSKTLKKTLSVVISVVLLICSVFSFTASAYELDNYDGTLDMGVFFPEGQEVVFGSVTSMAVKVCEEVDQFASYAVSFSYKGEAADVGFFTAEADGVYDNTNCVEAENATIIKLAAASEYTKATAYVTVDMKVAEGVAQGKALYMYFIGSNDVRELKNVVVTKLESVGALNADTGEYVVDSVVDQKGSMILKDYVDDPTATQAIRCQFNYDTTDGTDIVISGQSFDIVERGFIFANGSSVADYGVNITSAAAESSKYILKSVATEEALKKCWLYRTTKAENVLSLHFSTYVSGFECENNSYSTKQLYVKGYVKFTDGTNEFYLYSQPINESVSSIATQLGVTGV